MIKYEINEELNGIEITFEEKPSEEIRNALKASRFRWHKVKKIWYAKNTPERLDLVESLAAGNVPEVKAAAKAKSAPKANKYGVQIGDLFSASWGYEQTQTDFFQVVELCGASSVRVREVCPTVTNRQAVSGMSEDTTYKLTSELLPPCERSVFIKDQQRGDIKRLKSYHADGISHPEFKLSSFANAYYVGHEGEITAYNSWYY